MNHALHGKRSEKLTEDERQLAFEDLSIALAEVEVQQEDLATKPRDKMIAKPAPKRTIGNLPAELPRIAAWLTVVESRDDTCRLMDEAWF